TPPAEDCAHTGAQFPEAERLGDVIIGPGIEPGDAVRFRRARRQHDDRNFLRLGASPHDAADFFAAHDRDVEIEDDQVGWTTGDRTEGFITTAHDFDRSVAGSFEGVFDEAGDVVLVFDDEYPRSSHGLQVTG